MGQVLRITRGDLYEKVWQTPMQKLANEFGLADVGLAKLWDDTKFRCLVAGIGLDVKSDKSRNAHHYLTLSSTELRLFVMKNGTGRWPHELCQKHRLTGSKSQRTV